MQFEQTHVAAIRSALQHEADNGRLGVVAARSRVSEGELFNWLHNGPAPSYESLVDLHDVLAPKVTSEADVTYNGYDCMFFKKQAE